MSEHILILSESFRIELLVETTTGALSTAFILLCIETVNDHAPTLALPDAPPVLRANTTTSTIPLFPSLSIVDRDQFPGNVITLARVRVRAPWEPLTLARARVCTDPAMSTMAWASGAPISHCTRPILTRKWGHALE